MKITFLGTGTSQGVPVIACTCSVCQSLDPHDKRLRTSVHIEVGGKSFVIDSGPDFRQQMLKNNIHKLDAILFTHEHKDHTGGLDDVRAYNFKQQMDMPVYAAPRVQNRLKREYAYIFADTKYPGVPRVALHDVLNHPFQMQGTTVTPIEVMHYQLPIFGYRIGNFTYITDAKTISDEEKEKAKGSEVLVLNALQQNAHLSHLTLSEALSLVKELEPQQAYLTHISHKLGLHREVEDDLPENVCLAYDGMQIQVTDPKQDL